ncbi:MAG TPA: TfoX/Sxy family protein [Acidimicrobiales bacterium]|nr:TfoX/Sxy family protein [Acidimicrobiales bacterium]
MAYDEVLANRIREVIGARRDLRETKMFGGLGFLVGGHLAVAVMSASRGMMVRVDPTNHDAMRAQRGAGPFVMREREMPGWIIVEAEALRTTRDLTRWVRRGLAYAQSLPPKS